MIFVSLINLVRLLYKRAINIMARDSNRNIFILLGPPASLKSTLCRALKSTYQDKVITLDEDLRVFSKIANKPKEINRLMLHHHLLISSIRAYQMDISKPIFIVGDYVMNTDVYCPWLLKTDSIYLKHIQECTERFWNTYQHRYGFAALCLNLKQSPLLTAKINILRHVRRSRLENRFDSSHHTIYSIYALTRLLMYSLTRFNNYFFLPC